MRVDGQLNSAALWFKTVEKNPAAGLDTLVDQATAGKTEPANPASSNTVFPTRAPLNLDSASILSLQQIEFEVNEKGEPTGIKATDEFLAYMQKTPEERMRANILKSLGLTEEELESLPPEQRQAVEEKIREMIKDQIRPASELGIISGEALKNLRSRLTGMAPPPHDALAEAGNNSAKIALKPLIEHG